ncbi:MAG: toxin-antitoxin system YwqK family antitoxin [Gammaproteobacteria bacterium]
MRLHCPPSSARQAAVAGLLIATAAGLVVVDHAEQLPREVHAAKVTIDRPTGQRVVDGVPFTGVAVSDHPNGRRASAEPFIDGRRDGTLRRWYPDGKIAFVSEYQGGRREGQTQSWWRNGNRRSTTTYVHDKPDGIAMTWYRGGEKFKKFQFTDGRPTGLQQGWRRNGKLFSNFEYRNGRTYGLKNSNLCVELEDENLVVRN